MTRVQQLMLTETYMSPAAANIIALTLKMAISVDFPPNVSDYRLMNNRRKVFTRPQNSMNRFFRRLLFLLISILMITMELTTKIEGCNHASDGKEGKELILPT